MAIVLPIPTGLFTPVFLLGAVLGRLIGETLSSIFPSGAIVPGGYAVVGIHFMLRIANFMIIIIIITTVSSFPCIFIQEPFLMILENSINVYIFLIHMKIFPSISLPISPLRGRCCCLGIWGDSNSVDISYCLRINWRAFTSVTDVGENELFLFEFFLIVIFLHRFDFLFWLYGYFTLSFFLIHQFFSWPRYLLLLLGISSIFQYMTRY